MTFNLPRLPRLFPEPPGLQRTLPGRHAFPPSAHSETSRLNFHLTVHGVVKVNFVRGEGSGCSVCECLPASNVTPDLHIFAELLENVPNSP